MNKTQVASAAIPLASTGLAMILVPNAPALATDLNYGHGDQAQATTAAQPISGYVQLYGGFSSFDELWNYDIGPSVTSPGSTSRIGGAGRLNWWFNPNWSFQADVQGTGITFNRGSTKGWTGTAFGMAGHITKRDPSSYAIGVMGSLGSTAGMWDGEGITWGTIAVEGQWYPTSNFTLYGQAGLTDSLQGDSGDNPQIWYGALQGRYFFKPNLELSGDVTYGQYSEPGEGNSIWRWGVGLDWKPDTMPFSVFARYQGEHLVYTYPGTSTTTTNHEVLAGVKFWFGDGHQTLQSNDRMGATLLDLNPQYGEFSSYFIE